MDSSGAFPQDQTAGSEPEDLSQSNNPRAQTSHEGASRPQIPTVYRSFSNQVPTHNTYQSPPQSNRRYIFHPNLINEEMFQMLLQAEDAIERSLSAANEFKEKELIQEYILNLAYYVTHYEILKFEALNWLAEYAKSAIGITLDNFYQEDPLNIPLQLLAYLMHQTALPPKLRTITLPPHRSPVYDIPSSRSTTSDTDILDRYPRISHNSRSEPPAGSSPRTTPSTSQASTPNVPTEAQNKGILPPFMSLLILTIANCLKRNPTYPGSYEEESQISEDLLWERLSSPPYYDTTEASASQSKAQVIPARSLFEEPSGSDWKYLEHWVTFLKGADLFDEEDLAWILLRIVETQETLT